ncbi:amidohydrolase family protein [Hippea maritima]|uniref:Amidohydrolase n=1 Tax=Hippea maritima (strain ATCC 700847 / DSM 10411 / MH2) TaxID=760142 RepID=F2LTH9_HIPMA|nr:amidohydrolase family protein [Hippea maritima]AEA33304.1 amidohydrolase [Hippea maritima DSM 10411]
MRFLRAKYLFDGLNLKENFAVVVNGSSVVDVGAYDELRKSYIELEVNDLGEGVLFCGFVNAHTHLELSYLKGKTEAFGGFVKWLASVMSNKSRYEEYVVLENMDKSIDELIENGVAIVGDISNTLISIDRLSKKLPLSVVFYENYSLNLERAFSAIDKLEKEGEMLSRMPIRIQLTPHAVYSSHPILMRYLCSKTDFMSLHFLESKYEKEFISGKGELYIFLKELGLLDYSFEYKNIWDYLKKLGCLKPKGLFVHCTEAEYEDLEMIRSIDGSVVLCPRSNWYISRKLPDVYKIEKSGLNIAIGTDSLASNWDLNILNEMAFLKDHFPDIKSESIFRWATSGGAKALRVKLGFFKGFYAKPYFIAANSSNPLDEILQKRGYLPLPY